MLNAYKLLATLAFVVIFGSIRTVGAAEAAPDTDPIPFEYAMLEAVAKETMLQAELRNANCPTSRCAEPREYRGRVKVIDQEYSFVAAAGVIAYTSTSTNISGAIDVVSMVRANNQPGGPGVRCPACIYIGVAIVGAIACHVSQQAAYNQCRNQCSPCPVRNASFTCGGVIGNASCECQPCQALPRPRSGTFLWGPLTTGGSAPFPTLADLNNGPFIVGDGWGWIGN